ncbi:putative transcription factor C2H2 family [Rosa chinensis]|uniref:RING-type E3 ubiquitin transferase n=1 Tax=Rosa chinensis TaxID=74649 RepID=A0A2P6S7C4_ROSCH|nr:E3 ubiquitin-protein ligase Praja-1 [Rosa chinensis]PRQ54534.1 putative transcription factor C2H2 family [Rosa chinensis]
MQVVPDYCHAAVQKPEGNFRGSLEEDKLPIILQFYKSSILHRGVSDPGVLESPSTLLEQREIWVKFSHFKQQLSNNYDSNREYEALISESLSNMGVPQDEHPATVHKLFQAVEAAVDPDLPVVVGVFDTTHRIIGDGDGHESCRPNSIPASRSSIEGLEPVTLDSDIITRSPSCAICLEDFEQEPITRLPCRHHFHVHCIVQCLEISHMCPLCRYPMPTEED